MRHGWRFIFGLTLTIGALPLAGCTVKDASDVPPAAGSAASTAGTAAAPPLPDPVPAPGAPASAALDSSPAPAGAFTPGAAGPATATRESLSPDSVDVGRKARDMLPVAGMRLEVDLAARSLYVYDGVKRVGTHRVAIGSTKWPTKTGEWYVVQVVWNPEWLPPDESWAEQRTPKKPGAADNPLGRAQLVYDPPRTIHGTNEPASIGKAVSHGSIRLANSDVVQLGRLLMETTGAGKDDAWYQQVQQNRTEKVIVDLPQRVPIRVF